MVATGPGRLVRRKLVEISGVVPGMDATTVSAPAALLAVYVDAVAKPLTVFTTLVFAAPAKVPLAGVEGAWNVTLTPLTRFPPWSVTFATRAAKAVLIATPGGNVPLTAIAVGGPTTLLSVKLA